MEMYHQALLMVISSFIISFKAFPYFIDRFKERGITDLVDDKEVPTTGGLLVIIFYLASISIFSLLGIRFCFTCIAVLLSFAVFGFFYDLIKIPEYLKVVVPIFFSLPLLPMVKSTAIHVLGYTLNLGTLYYFLLPIYIMVTANLVYLRSDYNGLPAYTALIILSSLLTISYYRGMLSVVNFALPLLGVALAFSYYNFYPSKILQGNIGIILGASVGIVAVLCKLEFIGFIMLLPHVVNFLMFFYFRQKGIDEKVARVREDGTLDIQRPVTLKWLLAYHFKLTETQACFIMFVLVGLSCILGIHVAAKT